jgi:hypothetical protein
LQYSPVSSGEQRNPKQQLNIYIVFEGYEYHLENMANTGRGTENNPPISDT